MAAASSTHLVDNPLESGSCFLWSFSAFWSFCTVTEEAVTPNSARLSSLEADDLLKLHLLFSICGVWHKRMKEGIWVWRINLFWGEVLMADKACFHLSLIGSFSLSLSNSQKGLSFFVVLALMLCCFFVVDIVNVWWHPFVVWYRRRVEKESVCGIFLWGNFGSFVLFCFFFFFLVVCDCDG